MKAIRFAVVACLALMVVGCGNARHKAAPEAHAKAANDVYIGMSQYEFIQVMTPVTAKTQSQSMRSPKRYSKNGNQYEVRYMRSGWLSDGRSTDDEYTPYLFQNGTLIASGWDAVGGMKFTAQDVAAQNRAAVRSCLAKGHLPDHNQFSGKYQRCIPVDVDESEEKKLECLRAGGQPKTRIVRASGRAYDIYETCVARSAVVKTYCNTTTIGNQQHTNCKTR